MKPYVKTMRSVEWWMPEWADVPEVEDIDYAGPMAPDMPADEQY